jgi:hypothetical protein
MGTETKVDKKEGSPLPHPKAAPTLKYEDLGQATLRVVRESTEDRRAMLSPQ